MIPILNKIFNTRPITARQKSAALDLAMFNLSLVGEAQGHIDEIQNELGMNEAERNAFWQSNYSQNVYASIKASKEAKAPLTKTKHGFLTNTPHAKPKTKPQAKAAAKPTAIQSKPAAPVVNLLTALCDGELITAATHRSAPTAGKPAARAELLRRGITVSEDGQCITRSHNFKPTN